MECISSVGMVHNSGGSFTGACLSLAIHQEPSVYRNAVVCSVSNILIAVPHVNLSGRNTFFVGAPYTVAIVQIPQRFQAVNGVSSLGAGIRLLPLAFSSPVGSFSSAILSGKLKVPPVFLLIAASVLQTIGAALLSTIPIGTEIEPAQYGYEVLLGFGLGLSIPTLLNMVPVAFQRRDQGQYTLFHKTFTRADTSIAVAMGAITQFRAMGGATGLAVVTSVMNSSIKSALAQNLSSEQLNAILQTAAAIELLPAALQKTTRDLFAQEYNLQMRIIIGFAAAQTLAALLMWPGKLPRMI